MKTLITIILSIFLFLNAQAKPQHFEGCKSHLNFYSSKLGHTIIADSFFKAVFDFDPEKKSVGGGELTLRYIDENGKVNGIKARLICRELEETIPTVALEGMTICETNVSILEDKKFFVTYEGYSGTLQTSRGLLHGSVGGVLTDRSTKEVLWSRSCE